MLMHLVITILTNIDKRIYYVLSILESICEKLDFGLVGFENKNLFKPDFSIIIYTKQMNKLESKLTYLIRQK